MVASIVHEVPVYRRARREVIEDVRALSTATAQILSRALSGATQVQREDVPVVREHAALRLRQGIELEPFLHAYRAALFCYWDSCAEEAVRLEISRDASIALARFTLDAIDTITTHAAEAYLREDSRRQAQSGRDARDLVERLIAGQWIPAPGRHSAAPGLDPAGRLAVVVARVQSAPLGAGDALPLARDGLEQSMALGKVRPLVTIRQGEIVLITGGSRTGHISGRLHMAQRRALEEHGLDVRYGVSDSSSGFGGVATAYREAVLSLSYTSPARPVVSLEQLSALESALLGANATTRQVIAAKSRALAALPDAEREVAAATVRAFAGCDMNIARTATQLAVHPNTIRYRLARVAQSTGHDPRTFAGLIDLICVVELARLQSAE